MFQAKNEHLGVGVTGVGGGWRADGAAGHPDPGMLGTHGAPGQKPADWPAGLQGGGVGSKAADSQRPSRTLLRGPREGPGPAFLPWSAGGGGGIQTGWDRPPTGSALQLLLCGDYSQHSWGESFCESSVHFS